MHERQVVDDVVQLGAVELWQMLLDAGQPREHAVARVDDDRDVEPEEGRLHVVPRRRRAAPRTPTTAPVAV